MHFQLFIWILAVNRGKLGKACIVISGAASLTFFINNKINLEKINSSVTLNIKSYNMLLFGIKF